MSSASYFAVSSASLLPAGASSATASFSLRRLSGARVIAVQITRPIATKTIAIQYGSKKNSRQPIESTAVHA